MAHGLSLPLTREAIARLLGFAKQHDSDSRQRQKRQAIQRWMEFYRDDSQPKRSRKERRRMALEQARG